MKLPSVYANKIDKKIDNNEVLYRTDGNNNKKDAHELRKYFDEYGYANKLLVDIRTVSGVKREKLILYKGDYVININNEIIYLDDIIDYNVES